jgi:hypothetical protein
MLKPFKDEEAKQWFSLFQPMNIDHELFRKLTGFHPYLMTQLMELLQSLPGLDNSEALKDALVQNNKEFVLNLINSLPANHKDVFTNLALGFIPKKNQQYIVNTLVSKGYFDADWVITSEIIQAALISIHHEKKWNKWTTSIKRFFYT